MVYIISCGLLEEKIIIIIFFFAKVTNTGENVTS